MTIVTLHERTFLSLRVTQNEVENSQKGETRCLKFFLLLFEKERVSQVPKSLGFGLIEIL